MFRSVAVFWILCYLMLKTYFAIFLAVLKENIINKKIVIQFPWILINFFFNCKHKNQQKVVSALMLFNFHYFSLQYIITFNSKYISLKQSLSVPAVDRFIGCLVIALSCKVGQKLGTKVQSMGTYPWGLSDHLLTTALCILETTSKLGKSAAACASWGRCM